MGITLSALMLFAIIGLTATESFAIRKVCAMDGTHCCWQWGNCDGVYSMEHRRTCNDFLTIPTPNPSTQYILKKPNGQAFIVLGNDVTAIASDKLENFNKEIDNKYPAGKREDEKAQQNIQSEFDAFFKTDDGRISDANLQKWSKETGLQILDKAPVTGTITITKPGKDATIDIDSKQPVTFAWKSTVKGPHTIKLFVVKEGQTPEDAMINNKPDYQKEGITNGSVDILPYFGIDKPGIKIYCVVSCGDVIGYASVNTSRSNIKRGK